MGLLPAELTASLGWEDQTLETSWNQSGHLHRSDSFGKMPVFGFSCKLMVRKIADCKSACVPLHTGWWEDSFLFFYVKPCGFLVGMYPAIHQNIKVHQDPNPWQVFRQSVASQLKSCHKQILRPMEWPGWKNWWMASCHRTESWQGKPLYILARSKNFKTLELHRQIMAINEVSNKYLPKIWQI